MEISTTSSIYTAITSLQTNSSIKTKSVNDLASGTDSFIIAKNEKTQASDYTYDEYKKLSAKDINEIFPWDKMPHENEKAQKLQLIATLSPDETLNQVLFDQAKNADFNDISTRNFFDRTLKSAEIERACITGYAFENSEKVKLGINGSFQPLSNNEKDNLVKEEGYISLYSEIVRNPTENKDLDGIVDAKTYFDIYQMSEDYFNEYKKDLSESSQKYWPGEFTLFHKVKSEYERRVSQNDNALNQLTKNTKPNPLEINI